MLMYSTTAIKLVFILCFLFGLIYPFIKNQKVRNRLFFFTPIIVSCLLSYGPPLFAYHLGYRSDIQRFVIDGFREFPQTLLCFFIVSGGVGSLIAFSITKSGKMKIVYIERNMIYLNRDIRKKINKAIKVIKKNIGAR
jgi:hypothetical protein